MRYGTIASYAWNFGDGTTAVTSTPTTTHEYAGPGTFTARVTLTSSGGTSTTQFHRPDHVPQRRPPGRRLSRFLIGTLGDPATTTTTTTAPGGAGATTTTVRRMTGTLPATGGGTGGDLIVPATVFLVGGAVALAIARRRPQT